MSRHHPDPELAALGLRVADEDESAVYRDRAATPLIAPRKDRRALRAWSRAQSGSRFQSLMWKVRRRRLSPGVQHLLGFVDDNTRHPNQTAR